MSSFWQFFDIEMAICPEGQMTMDEYIPDIKSQQIKHS